MEDPILRFEAVDKTYAGADGPVPVLRDVSLRLGAGETVALTGESGSGKSTLLHLAAGLDTPDKGRITLGGSEIGPLGDTERAALRRAKVGLVFQQFNLVPSLTVGGNITLQARLADRFDPAFADTLAARLGLAKLAGRYPEQLSGGQQQRVAIARALAHKPALVLADEPTGNLDQATGDEVIGLLLELVAETGSALLMVTHSDRLAARLSRRLHLERGHLAEGG